MTSCPLDVSKTEVAIPQLPAPTTATFDIIN